MFVKKLLCYLVGLVIATGQIAQADLINFDLGNGGLYSGAGALGTAGDIWNGIATAENDATTYIIDAGSVVDSSGAVVTGLSAQVFASDGAFFGYTGGGAGTFVDLADSARDNTGDGSASVSFILSGLTAGDRYDVVAYAGRGDVASPNLISVNGGSAQAIDGINQFADPLVGGSDYTTFASVAVDGNGELVITAQGDGTFTRFSGVQIQNVSAIPEPASVALLSGIGIAFFARRKRQSLSAKSQLDPSDRYGE